MCKSEGEQASYLPHALVLPISTGSQGYSFSALLLHDAVAPTQEPLPAKLRMLLHTRGQFACGVHILTQLSFLLSLSRTSAIDLAVRHEKSKLNVRFFLSPCSPALCAPRQPSEAAGGWFSEDELRRSHRGSVPAMWVCEGDGYSHNRIWTTSLGLRS